MLLFLLSACSTDELAAYAGCTVTTFLTDHERVESATRVEVYDREARLVESRQEEQAGHVAVWTATYDGDCLLEQVEELTFGSEGDVTTTHRTCDEHGHVEREERETSSDGGAPVAGRTYVYTNTHDDEGRLVEVETFDAWGDGSTSVVTYEWEAPCTEPAATRTVDANGNVNTTSMRCRADGRGESGEYVSLGEHGADDRFFRWSRTFGGLGRMLTESWDDSEDTTFDGTFTNTWGDALAPGPTEQVLHRGPDDLLASTAKYTYACGL